MLPKALSVPQIGGKVFISYAIRRQKIALLKKILTSSKSGENHGIR
jgi:hypothetical protein